MTEKQNPGNQYKRFLSNWRSAGAVERDGLENRCTFRGTEGSNPSLSARKFNYPRFSEFLPSYPLMLLFG